MSCHAALASLLLATALPACVDAGGAPANPGDPDLSLAADAEADVSGAWDVAPTLHVGERTTGRAPAHGRRVYPVWIAASPTAPVSLDVIATADDGDDVRVAVLAPLAGGDRRVLAAGGYAQPRGNVEMTVTITTTGQHLIVIGAFDLATETSFAVHAECDTCTPAQTDVLASPKDGALVGTGDRTLHAVLGEVVAASDVEIELWASPPATPGAARLVGTSSAIPASVLAGDDLRLIVRDRASGAVLDDGLTTRFAPTLAPLVRTDALRYGSGTLLASGIAGFTEGRADLSMRAELAHVVLADSAVTAARPGQLGNGWGAFDATFATDLAHAGDLVSIGSIDGDGTYNRIACFTYGGGAQPCPTAAW